MSVSGITAENATNLTEIEKQWAVRAYEHAETYYRLVCEVEPSTLRLTRIDDEIYIEFRRCFPHMNVSLLTPADLNDSAEIKEKWRAFILPFEKRIAHYNFGSLIRLDASLEYNESNSYFVTRTQFYAIEIARNRETINNVVYERHQAKKRVSCEPRPAEQ